MSFKRLVEAVAGMGSGPGEGVPEKPGHDSNSTLKRIVYFKKASVLPPPGEEVILLLRDGSYDIGTYNPNRKAFVNRRNLVVHPKFWFEKPPVPSGVEEPE